MYRGWGTCNSTVGQLLQVESSAVDPDQVQAILEAQEAAGLRPTLRINPVPDYA